MLERKKDSSHILSIYKKNHKPKQKSIHIDALGALNSCTEEECKSKKVTSCLFGEKTQIKDELKPLGIELSYREKQKMAEGRSSGEFTPNNQICSASDQ